MKKFLIAIALIAMLIPPLAFGGAIVQPGGSSGDVPTWDLSTLTYTPSSVDITDEVVYRADCSSFEDGLCIDTDDDSLWYWGGLAAIQIHPRNISQFSEGTGLDPDFLWGDLTDDNAIDVDYSITADGITDTSTEATNIAVGTTGSRPVGIGGDLRLNSSLGALEAYDGASWDTLVWSGDLTAYQPILPDASGAGQALVWDGSDWVDGGGDFTYASSIFSVLSGLEVDGSGTYPSTTLYGGAASGSVGTALTLENTQTGADGGGVGLTLAGKDALDADVTFGKLEGYHIDESAGTFGVRLTGADVYTFDGPIQLPNSTYCQWVDNAGTGSYGLTLNTSNQIQSSTDIAVAGITAASGADVTVTLGDVAGSNKVSFKDSSSAETFAINSDGGFQSTPMSITIADTGDANPATYTLTPTASTVLLTCNDSDTCDITMGETGAVSGFFLTIINMSSNSCDFSDTAGVSELASSNALGEYDTLQMLYASDRWIETGRADN